SREVRGASPIHTLRMVPPSACLLRMVRTAPYSAADQAVPASRSEDSWHPDRPVEPPARRIAEGSAPTAGKHRDTRGEGRTLTGSAVPAPMLAVAGQAPDTPEWAVEMKWDGVRAIVICRDRTCRLYSRNRREITGSYPELTAALTAGAGNRELVLDGEIIAQTPAGAPSFALLQRRMHVARPGGALVREVPVQLFLVDVLVDGGETVTGEPYLRRRERL